MIHAVRQVLQPLVQGAPKGDVQFLEFVVECLDSTGVKIYGEGEWLDQKHGVRSRRRWRCLD